jgi:hypothetical protein
MTPIVKRAITAAAIAVVIAAQIATPNEKARK